MKWLENDEYENKIIIYNQIGGYRIQLEGNCDFSKLSEVIYKNDLDLKYSLEHGYIRFIIKKLDDLIKLLDKFFDAPTEIITKIQKSLRKKEEIEFYLFSN